ncbi:major facilitator superfamily domain-containing protein [Colletotrichum lupini]|nr:major facilitator superfamily domain-containing protein [Colletotrichum lupini]
MPRAEGQFLVDWDDGDNDPLCPRSYGKTRKWLITMVVSQMALCITCASSIYTSTYPNLEAEFHNSRIVSTLGLSTFVLGLSLGPMLFSPLSEFYGRRPIYLISSTCHLLFLIPQATARNITTLVILRFLDGFSGSAFQAVSAGTVRDSFSNDELQAPMLLFSICPFIGPSLGPLVGGFINYYTGWRWTFYVLIMWSFVLELGIVFLVPETYHPILLRNKARNLRKETEDDCWKAASEMHSKSVLGAVGISLLRPIQLLIFEPMCLSLCLFSALLLGILYLFFGAFPLVFRETYGFNLYQIGCSFLGILVGMLLGIATDPVWHKVRIRLILKNKGQGENGDGSEPEFRLPPAMFGSILVPVGIFMFGWSMYPWVHWIVPIVGTAMFGAGNILLFTGIWTFLVEAYPRYAASALAANSFVRCLAAAAFPLFGNQMYVRLGFQWASSLLGFLAIGMMVFPYLFFKYGKLIRGKSKFADASISL